MSIDPEMLMAYVDGELDPLSARRVEQAAEADPALAAEIARHRALQERMRAAFDPIAASPPPDALVGLLRDSAKVTDIADARERRSRRSALRWLPAGGAVAAALVLGLVLGQALPRGEGAFAMQDGTLIARGATAKALDAQLASAPGREGAVRILLSFRRTDGGYCRAFETAAQAAIACRRGGAWQVEALRAAGPAASTTEYRQASSETGALMADAQEMMAGEPLDAEDERAAIRAGWAAAPGR